MSALSLLRVALACAVVTALASSAPSQLRLHLAPSTDALVIAWTTLGASQGSSIVRFGSTPDSLNASAPGVQTSFENSYCTTNSTRTSHYATFPVAAGDSAFYSVSGDGGATWSDPRMAHNPARSYPISIALWGDLGVECGGVLPPSPGFAGGQCSAAGQVAVDAAAGKHSSIIHFGDTAYNMDDRCGQKGDAFLDAVQTYQASWPAMYTNGNHEGSSGGHLLKPYTEFTKRLAWGQTPLATASNSTSVRWMSWRNGPATFIALDPDAWIYPVVYPLLPEQFAWLEAAIARVDRSETPWLIFLVHRAAYCTKSTDPECNSEAEALRNGQLGLLYALEPLMAKYGVDLYFSGHTHHVEWTWPVVRGAATATNYDAPRGTIHIQSGIAGTGPGDEFSVPQQPWEAFRDTEYWPTYGRLTFFNASSALYEQLFNDNGTVFNSFQITNAAHTGW